MPYLISDLVTSSFRLINRLAPGRTIGPSELAAGVECLNAMIDSWNADRLFIYRIAAATYTLTPNTQSYTIGPSAATFTAARPERIERANIVDVLSNPAQPSRTPLELIDSRAWSEIAVRSVSSPLPDRLYYDRAYPNGSLSLYPYPSVANQLELFTWGLMGAVASGDTLSVPPGYQEALKYNLAVRMVPEVKDGQLIDSVVALAQSSLARIQGMNAPSPVLRADEGMPKSNSKGSFNWLVGE